AISMILFMNVNSILVNSFPSTFVNGLSLPPKNESIMAYDSLDSMIISAGPLNSFNLITHIQVGIGSVVNNSPNLLISLLITLTDVVFLSTEESETRNDLVNLSLIKSIIGIRPRIILSW